MENLTGLIFDIYRATTHDGPGMRTTAFFKGCPLKCEWCQNPESICKKPQIAWNGKKCIGCRTCVSECTQNAVIADEKGIHIKHSECTDCFKCTDECPSGALKKVGKQYTVKELADELCKDEMFFDEFDGGITASGGEPTLQFDFLKELFIELKSRNKHLALDTCGMAKPEVYKELFPLTDIFLYDIKILDAQKHKEFIGADNKLILENIELIVNLIKENPLKQIWIRTPLIPNATATEENIEQIAEFLDKYHNIIDRWELCAFNNVCKDKYRQLNKVWQYQDEKLINYQVAENLLDIARTYYKGDIIISGLTAK